MQEHVPVTVERRLQRLRQADRLRQRAGQRVGLILFGHRVQPVVGRAQLLAEYRRQAAAGGRRVRRRPGPEVGTATGKKKTETQSFIIGYCVLLTAIEIRVQERLQIQTPSIGRLQNEYL